MTLEATGLTTAPTAPRLPAAREGKGSTSCVVYHSGFGAPAAAMLMETLVASGVTTVYMIGEAGSITGSCCTGDIVLPTWGLREEGTSYHYVPPEVTCRPTPRALEDLRSFLAPTASWSEGGIWTTDAPFREALDKVQRFAMQGALVVEMECTALMAVAAYRGVEFGAVLVVTDELFSQRWRPAFDDERVRATRRMTCEAVGRGIKSKLQG